MKKIIAVSLTIALCLSLCACGKSAKAESGDQFVKSGTLTKANVSQEELSQMMNALDDVERQMVYFDNLSSMVLALKSDNIDEFWSTTPVGKYVVENNEDFTMAEIDSGVKYSMCMMEENQVVCDLISEAIKSMKEDGTLQKLQADLIDGENINLETADYTLPAFDSEVVIKVGITGDLPPMDYTLADGTPRGFNVAFLAELSNRMGMNVEIVNIDSSSRTVALTSGKVDALFWVSVSDLDGDGIFSDVPKGTVLSEPYFETKHCTVTKK